MKKPPHPPIVDDFDKVQLMPVIGDKVAMDFISEANSVYLPWSKFKYKAKALGYDPTSLWAMAKLLRGVNKVPIKLGKKLLVICSYSLSDKMHQKLHEFDMNIGGSMSGENIVPARDKDRYLISSIMEEAIASSQLEGAVTTRKIAKEMLRKERKPRNISEKMIFNNYLTIQKILEWKERKITKSSILQLHELVTKDTLDKPEYAGKFRDTNDVNVVDNETGEILHAPPSFELIDELIDSFCTLANNEGSTLFIHPIIRASILHFLIGYIHPFVDGNGRTARALFYWLLIKSGYWLMEYMSISSVIKKAPVQYAMAYLETEQDDNDLTYFLNYMLKTMDLAFKSLKEYINRKISEQQQLYDVATIDGINDRQSIILKSFLDDPKTLMTIKEVQNTFGVVYQTARTDLLGLYELGLLKKKTEGKKKAVFFRPKEFRKLLQKFSAEP